MLTVMLNDISFPKSARVLDFGAGDGWFASQISAALPGANLRAVDVQKRPVTHYNVEIIESNGLSHEEAKSYDLAYAIDVLHHCKNPMESLADLAQLTRGYLMIKDHVAFSRADMLTLGILDEIGNRKFGIPSNYHYQKSWEWEEMLLRSGWQKIQKLWPAPCHTGILGRWTNRLQYVALYRSLNF